MKSIQRLSIQSFSIRVVIILVCDNIKSLCAQLSHCVCVNWFDEKGKDGMNNKRTYHYRQRQQKQQQQQKFIAK